MTNQTEIIAYSAKVLKSSLCNYNDDQNDAPFTKFITKINVTLINDTEELDLVISMYNLIE